WAVARVASPFGNARAVIDRRAYMLAVGLLTPLAGRPRCPADRSWTPLRFESRVRAHPGCEIEPLPLPPELSVVRSRQTFGDASGLQHRLRSPRPNSLPRPTPPR